MPNFGFCPIMQATEKNERAYCSPVCEWFDFESGKCAVYILAKANQKQSKIAQGEIDRRLKLREQKYTFQRHQKEQP